MKIKYSSYLHKNVDTHVQYCKCIESSDASLMLSNFEAVYLDRPVEFNVADLLCFTWVNLRLPENKLNEMIEFILLTNPWNSLYM